MSTDGTLESASKHEVSTARLSDVQTTEMLVVTNTSSAQPNTHTSGDTTDTLTLSTSAPQMSATAVKSPSIGSAPTANKVEYRTYYSNVYNRDHANTPAFASNMITTSKYTLWSFLPVCIFEQFRRIANLYFLCIIIIMLIPGVSPFPIVTSAMPLGVILAVTAIKEAREDYLRHREDHNANSAKYWVLEYDDSIRHQKNKAKCNAASGGSSRPTSGRTGLTGKQISYSAASMSVSQVSFSRTNSVLTTVEVNRDSRLPKPEPGCRWVQKPSRDIIVGDVICILEGQEFPTDIVAVKSARSDNTCYINTANLDGEAVPKLRRALGGDCAVGEFQCPMPNPSMTSFNAVARLFVKKMLLKRFFHEEIGSHAVGDIAATEEDVVKSDPTLAMPNSPFGTITNTATPTSPTPGPIRNVAAQNKFLKTYSVSIGNLLMRGASLVNTPYIVGSVCYTGPHTKMMQNRSPAKIKFSHFETMLNRFIWMLLGLNFLICLGMSIGNVVQSQGWAAKQGISTSGFVDWIKSLCTHYILFSWMIPISLYVTIELVRVAQALFMEQDTFFRTVTLIPSGDIPDARVEDTDPSKNNTVTSTPDATEAVSAKLGFIEDVKKLKVNNSALNEEFGQVEYIFTDKTGTLTYNNMDLAAVACGGETYLHEIERDEAVAASAGTTAGEGNGKEGVNTDIDAKSDAIGIKALPHAGTVLELISSATATLPFPALTTAAAPPTSRESLFLLTLLLNNDVNPSHCGTDKRQKNGWTFASQSPDEVALCEALRDCGLLLINKNEEKATVLLSNTLADTLTTSGLLHASPIDSARSTNTTAAHLDLYSADAPARPGSGSARAAYSTPAAYEMAALGTVTEDEEDDDSASSPNIVINFNTDTTLTTDADTDSAGVGATTANQGTASGFKLKLPNAAPGNSQTPDAQNPESRLSEVAPVKAPLSRTTSSSANGNYTRELLLVPEDMVVEYHIKAMLEFTSARRRSTIVALCPYTNVAMLLIKGADSTIFPLCAEDDVLTRTKATVRAMSGTGARTLVFAARVMSTQEYTSFIEEYVSVMTGMSDDRDQAIEDLFKTVEKDMLCVGASAVNDQIQDGARDTVERLLEAGINVTVVTGDKRETAVSIAKESAIVPGEADLIFTYEHAPLSVWVRPVPERLLQADTSDIEWNKHLTALAKAAEKGTAAPGPVIISTYDDQGMRRYTPSHDCCDTACRRLCTGDTNLYWCSGRVHAVQHGIEIMLDTHNYTAPGREYTCMVPPPEEEEEPLPASTMSFAEALEHVAQLRGVGAQSIEEMHFPLHTRACQDGAWEELPVPLLAHTDKALVKLAVTFMSVLRCACVAQGIAANDTRTVAHGVGTTQATYNERAGVTHNGTGTGTGGHGSMGEGGVIEMENITAMARATHVSAVTASSDSTTEGMGGVTGVTHTVERGDVSKPVSLCISGDYMELALTKLTPLAMTLLSKVKSVVAFRCAPRQKQMIVAAVKNQGHVCVAVGDGANDVSMIQESSIGVGILGKEGAHAAMSGDVVIYRFKHLERLILYHGRYNFYRNSLVVLHAFYKNFVFVLPVVWYSFYNQFTGQILTLSYFMSFYNLLFTSLPLLAIGALEMDMPSALLLRYPQAYKALRAEHSYNLRGLVQWIFLAAVQSVIIFFFTIYGMYFNDIDSTGHTNDLWGPGNGSTLAVIVLVNLLMLFDCVSITWINALFNFLGIVAFFLIYIIFSFYNWTTLAPDAFGVMEMSYPSAKYWLYIILIIGTCMVPYMIWRVIRMVFPSYAGKMLGVQKAADEWLQAHMAPQYPPMPYPSDGKTETNEA